jgi:RNA polymerase sigma-70 factor (ECF subfamily)
MDEEALNRAMESYASGNDAAFTAIYRGLAPRLHGYLLRLCGSPAVADDLLQDTFLRIHRARSTFAPGAAIVPWAYAISRNAHVDHARSSKQKSTERLPSDPGQEPAVVVQGDAESSAIATRAARVVEDVLQKLPALQRDAFVLIRYEGMSVQDAAAILGATPTAVKLRAFRAYEALREALAEHVPERALAKEGDAKPTGAANAARKGDEA